MYPISEIFHSVEGEGLYTGLPTIFIRTSGCDYATDGHPCRWCDTAYAWNKGDIPYISDDDLIKLIDRFVLSVGCKLLWLTGGEPLACEGIENLIYYWSKHYTLGVETNGGHHIWQSDAIWSVDIKCPTSGNEQYNVYDNLNMLTRKDQVKFVIADIKDFEFAAELVKSRIMGTNVIFQPVYKELSLSTLAKWILSDKDLQHVRLGQQFHKQIWPRKKRGM